MNLDQRLSDSSEFIIDLKLCQVRLSKNAAFPWILLIPKPENIIELIDLSVADQHQLMNEIAAASSSMKDLFTPDKLNVATLGNVVPQLHIHIIARYKSDPIWPNPVWNTIHQDYAPEIFNQTIDRLRERLSKATLK